MNEEDILALEANGYTYTGGGIIDAEGVYQSSVDLLGVTYNSVASQEEFDLQQEANEKYEIRQEEERVKKEEEQAKLQDYENAPLSNSIDEVSDSTYNEFMQEKVANNKPGAFDYREDFIAETEKEAVQKDLKENLETGNSLHTKTVFTGLGEDPMFKDKGIDFKVLDKVLPLEKRIGEIEAEDEDVDTRQKRFEAESNKQLEENSWYNPENITLYIDKYVGKAIAALSPDGATMENEELKKEYVALNEERKTVLKPEIEKITKILKEEKDIYDKDYEDNYSTGGSLFGREDQDINNYVRRQLQSKVDQLESYTEDSNIYNLFSEEFLTDVATFGLRDGHDAVKYRNYLTGKLESGVDLTDTEQRALENLGRIDLLDGLNLEQNVLYNLTYGAAHSVSYLAGGAGGRLTGKAVGKAISKGVVKGLEKGIGGRLTSKIATQGGNLAARESVGRAVGLVGDIATQATLHTSNLANTIDNYNGKVHMGQDIDGNMVIETDRMQYEAMENAIEKYQDGLDSGLGTPEQRENTKESLRELKEILAKTKEPQSWKGAFAKSWTGNFVESASEVATLSVLKGIPNNLVTRKLTEKYRKTPKWAKITAKAKGPRTLLEKINKPFPKTMEALNNFSGKRLGSPTIGGNLEEALEEVVVQTVPVWGETDAEAASRKDELLKGSFYFNVLAQAPIQKIIMSPVGNTMRAGKYLSNALDKDYRTTKKNFNNLMRELQKEGITKEEIDGIMMAAGSGNFSQVEYKNKIKDLEDRGETEQANKIRENRVFNGIFQAIKHGKGKKFIASLESSLAKQLAPTTIPSGAEQETIKATMLAISEGKAIMANTKKSEGMPNQEYILNLEYNKRNLEKNQTEIEKQVSILQGEEESPQRDEAIEAFLKVWEEGSKGIKFIDKKIKAENSAAKRKRYNDEKKMLIFSREHLLKEKNKKEGEAKVSLKDALKEAFGKTVSNQAYKNTNKRVESLNILETFKNELKEQQKAAEVPVPEKATETPETVTKVVTEEPGAMQNPFGAGTISGDRAQEVPDLGDEFKEAVAEDFQTIENTLANSSIEGGVDIFMGMEEDEMIAVLDESDAEHNPLVSIGKKMKAFSDSVKDRTGKPATFEDFLMAIGGNGTIANYQDYLTLFGNAWSNAGLGKVDVRKKYQEAIQIAKELEEKLNLANLEIIDTPDSTEKLEEEEKVIGIGQKAEEIEVDANGIPTVVPKREEVFDEVQKVNYSALEFTEEEVVDKETGEVYIKRTNAPIPARNQESSTNTNNLVHPSKNNKGDKLTVTETPIGEVGSIFVSVRDENGKTLRRISFAEWVEENQGDMSDEEFMESDEYIGKVPMYYTDSEGQKVGWVAEAEWFTPGTEGQKEGDKVKVSNLSDIEKREIEQKRTSALNLRKEILAGNVEEFEIVSDGSSFVRLKIQKEDAEGNTIPPKKLSVVAGTSHVAVMGVSGLNFIDNGVTIKTEDILNWGDTDSGFSKKVMKTSEDGKSKSAVTENAGKTVYVEHVTTVDGVKKYVATLTLRKNEENKEQARQDAIETVRILAAANTALMFGTVKGDKHPYKMTVEQAQQIHDQVKKETGLSLTTSLSTLIEGLVALKNPQGGKIIRGLEIAKLSHKGSAEGGMLVKDEQYVQNTTYGRNSHQGPIVSISQENGQFKVERIADSYEDYLKDTLTTNVMGYNVGTEANPVYTPALQQGVRVKAIKKKDVRPLSEKVEDTKKEEVVIKKTEKVKEEVAEVEEVQEILNEEVEEATKEEKAQRDEALETAVALINKLGGTLNAVEDTDELIVSEMTSAKNVADSILLTEGLTVEQEEDIIGSLSSELANKEAKFETILANLNKDLREAEAEIAKSQMALEGFKANLAVENVLDSLNTLRKQIKEVEKNKERLLEEASERGKRENFVVDTYEEAEGESIKDYSKKSNEAKPVDKLGTALKRLFAQVETGETGFLGRKRITPFKSMYDTVLLTLSSSIGSTTDFKDMMRILGEYREANFWVDSLIEKLESSDESIQNAFVYNMHAQKVTAYFSGFNVNGTELNATFFESNSNSAVRVIKNNWRENFKRSKINKKGKLNKEELNNLYEEYLTWGVSPEKQSLETLQNWLGKFGIRISDIAMKEIVKGELKIVKDGVAEKKTLKALFEESAGVFNILNKFLVDNKDKEKEVDFYANPKLHPFDNMHSIMDQLAYLEGKTNSKYASTTRRSGGKSLSEVENMTYFYQQIRKLKNSVLSKNSYIKKLREVSFSKDSYMLKMLEEDPEFLESFEHGLMDLMSLKDIFKDTPMFAGIDELSEEDYQLALRVAYQAKGRTAKLDKATGFKVRLAQMNTLTNSDKGRMMLLKTFVYDFYSSDQAFVQNEEGEFGFSENTNELMYDNYVMPELRRMFNFIKAGSQSDIKGYKEGAERFNIFPILNTVKNAKGETIRTSILRKIESLNKGANNVEDIEAAFTAIKKEFMAVTTKEIEKNTFAEAKRVSEKRKTQNDADFMKKRGQGTPSEKNLLAEVDFILNSKLTSMNYMQMVAGDPALYYKSRASAISENLKEATKGSIESAINIGKRMAAMIAPGKNLANSKNNKYIQLFMEDLEGAAENLLDIVQWHYSKKEIDEKNADTGRTYREMLQMTADGNKDFEGILKQRFSNIADFIGIESTDAQEYTTVKEHLYVLEKQGRIPKDVLADIRAKIDLQNEFYAKAENRGKEIPAEMSLSAVVNSKNLAVDGKTQLEILLQPIKPVYTGSILENDVNRMMYIKSSSFPLLAELTKGRKLDALRVQMERLELENPSLTVRASYQTANKVGALSKDRTIKDFTTDNITLDNGLILDREHFKIQQDVPNKSKKKQDDYVSMGTQIFKLLFGDGMTDLEDFVYEGQAISGEELKEKFFETFSGMVNLKKEGLLEVLGLDENMVPKDEKKSKILLQKLIRDEGKSRGFSKQDLKALELVGKNDNFRLPLWATGNSNKFEAMLNALINNKIFKQKIPGNKFVTGSEAGFEMAETTEKVDTSKVIHIGDYKGGVLKSARTKEGQIVKAEVLMPSRFKIAGELIDIFDGFNEATGEGVYIKLVDNVYQLKEEMFDKEMLEQFVFRIPTSSHGLGSAIKIVGFLPPESGDLIITPKGFVAQMGQDFDIDSLTAYQYNHVVRQNGKIERLTEENKTLYIEEKEDEIDTFERLISSQGKYGAEVAKMFDGLLASVLEEEDRETFNIYPHTKEELAEIVRDLKNQLKSSSDKKVLENKFVETHIAVFSNPKAQEKINKALSMAYAEGQASDIQQLVDKVLEGEEETFDMLSPEYQRVKMNNGSTGQVAIGIYAKGVTLHSSFQQAVKKGGVHLTRIVNKAKVRATVQIGKLSSTGDFGGKNSLTSMSNNPIVDKLARAISTVLDERTNTGTDNEKAQILGKTGLNHKKAIAVDSMLALLGFDSEHELIKEEDYREGEPFHRTKIVDGKRVWYKEYSIPYLLHSQPIIKEYFALLNQKESISNDKFSLNSQKETEEELLAKYGTPGYFFSRGEYGKLEQVGNTDAFMWRSSQYNGEFTGKRLSDNIILNEKADNKQQLEILALYTQLMNDAEGVKEAGQLIDMNNLGKSMWESTTKEEEFREYFAHLEKNSNLEGVELLVGDILFDGDVADMEEKDKVGLLSLGDGTYLKPTTNQGVLVGTALSLSANLFNGIFPAKSIYLNKVINKILANSKVKLSNTFALVKAKEHIFQEAKKYITSSQMLGLFNTNAKEVREVLFTDVPDYNVSLSSYIDHLYTDDSTEYEAGINKVRGNLFLNLLNFQYGEDGKPSLITFNNQESFEANQEAIYTAVKSLIAEDISLPPVYRNGSWESQSTRKLAQELIAYSYASGGIVQGALEFHKFLPIEYLDDIVNTVSTGRKMTASAVLRRFQNLFNDDSNEVQFLAQFEEQYFQNNPAMVPQMALKAKKIKSGGEFYLLKDEKAEKPLYVSRKNKTKSKLKQFKWSLFKLTSTGVYTEISVLGALGMAEYEFDTPNLTSSTIDKEYVRNEASGMEVQFQEDENLGTIPQSGTALVDVIDSIAKGEFGEEDNLKDIARFLLPLINKKDIFNYTEGDAFAKGSTAASTGQITINKDRLTGREDFAITFVHETLHNLSVRYMNEYINKDGSIIEGAPSEIYTFMNVFGQYKEQLRNLDPAKYDTFIKEYNEYKRKRNNNESISSDMFTLKGDEFEAYYAMINPKEFLAVTLSNQNQFFKDTANKMDYLANKQGLMEKLADVIMRIVNRISKREDLRDNSVALQAIKSSLLITKRGSESNFREYKKSQPMPTEMVQGEIPLAVLEQMEREAMEMGNRENFTQVEETEGDNFTPEGKSAGTSFTTIVEDAKNKCK